ncbi:MAG: hypothetical protein ACTSW1_15295 [Candidatus Hodarchaeales archaeon]
MTDSKEVAQLKDDLELVTTTAKVLATKLDKITKTFERLMASLDQNMTVPREHGATPVNKVGAMAQSTPRPQIRQKTEIKNEVRQTPSFQASKDTKAGRLLDTFLSKVQVLNTGKEISEALSSLRDQVMQASSKGFHPAFHEMGRYANQLKNLDTIPAEEKEALIEKIYDWKARLTS